MSPVVAAAACRYKALATPTPISIPTPTVCPACRPGTFEFDPVTEKYDRGEKVLVAQTRAAKAREVAKVRAPQ